MNVNVPVINCSKGGGGRLCSEFLLSGGDAVIGALEPFGVGDLCKFGGLADDGGKGYLGAGTETSGVLCCLIS